MKLTNTIFALCALGLAIAPVAAQDLDTTSITDQFNTGTRGNAVSTGATFGNSLTDGTEFLDYSGADSTGGAIRYINSFTNSVSGAGDTAFGESPVLDVTSATAGQGVGNPDRNLLPGTAIIANTRPGATGATTAVLTSDDGGTNSLHFGESDDANYFVEVDVFCYDQSAVAGNSWVFVALRSADNDPTANAGSFTVDRESSYSLVYDYNTLDVKLVYFPNDNALPTPPPAPTAPPLAPAPSSPATHGTPSALRPLAPRSVALSMASSSPASPTRTSPTAAPASASAMAALQTPPPAPTSVPEPSTTSRPAPPPAPSATGSATTKQSSNRRQILNRPGRKVGAISHFPLRVVPPSDPSWSNP